MWFSTLNFTGTNKKAYRGSQKSNEGSRTDRVRAQIPETGTRAQVEWKRSKAETSSVPPGATHSETLSNMSRTPVLLHHGETNPGSHVGHSATPSGHDPTKPNEYFNLIRCHIDTANQSVNGRGDEQYKDTVKLKISILIVWGIF